ncbi:DNA-binding protein [Rhodococcus sp. PAMC28707]|uniref:DNA-binding protein n=1 Tax=unclassified Rhodococcus (in: high G+C Gram-positive bacteria) TaxID=192944 RepID=UPI00109D92CC|nr:MULTISPECIES: DNA-binding protein [unclassified Rhodococcus (in: high G+C Gram-positive bacteria)]QCB49869.1 DNA-binding protein [Rhodococcus sp. PAMC28705]QCB58438.1 DNA-binding protein [Rhodococcus sp. PAMC28707]
MTTEDELDRLLRDRIDFNRSDLISAFRALHPQRPGSARLTAAEAYLLDSFGLTEDLESYDENAADVIANMARLYSTAYSPAEVAKGLNVSDSRLRQRRLHHTLWAIDDGGTWVYPAIQFELAESRRDPEELVLKHVRALDQVLPHLLRRKLHPAAVAGFLTTPRPELLFDGKPRSVREWLLAGEPVDSVLQLVEVGDWAGS